MKHLFRKLSKPALCLLFMVSAISCQDDDTDVVQKPDALGIEESPIISFDEIEKMTQNIIEGELAVANKNKATTKFGDVAREKSTYDFVANVKSGDGKGTELAGELDLNLTLYHANFTIIRGNLKLSDGTIAEARGAIVCDGKVYLIINPSGKKLIFGIGSVGENGDLTGRFTIFGDGLGRGDWKATLTKTIDPKKNIVELAIADGRFTKLVGALKAAELVETLSGDGPFTVLAPTDEAFTALSEVPSGDALKEVLLYHVISGKLKTENLLEKGKIKTIQGEEVTIALNEANEIVLNDVVKLVAANISASNGVIQVIDAVLVPPSSKPLPTIVELAIATPELSTLVGAVKAAGLVDALNGDGPFTVFAPTNDAFTALDAIPDGDALKEVLLYHVVSGKFSAADLLKKKTVTTLQGKEVTIEMKGDKVLLNGNIEVAIADVKGSNGIVHVITGVLSPPTDAKSILDIAIATPALSTLVSAVQSAGLVDALSGDGPFTVFAPTNDAFAALDAIPEGDALKEVLLYHVASGKFSAADLLEKKTVTTLQGKEVTIEMKGDKVLLNGNIEVAIADIEASNGIVHVITGVLLPPTEAKSILEIAKATQKLSTLVSVLQSAELVDVLNGKGPFTVFAPTDDAFAGLVAGPDLEAVKEVLLYHVSNGKFSAADLLEKKTITTLQGKEITIEKKGDNVLLNGSIEVATADIEATNGIIHVITSVLTIK